MLVERMAEAMWAEHARQTPGAPIWRDATESDRSNFIDYARAGLIAISNPSPDMMKQGNAAFHEWERAQQYRSPVGDVFRAMIGSELPQQERPHLETVDEF